MTKATSAAQLSPGTVIDGTYTLGSVVRTRGGSATYEATDLSGGRVEVTVYAQDSFASPVALERSLRELRQLEKVSTPQIVRVIDAGKMSGGGIYEVHEKLSGRTLAELGALAASDVVHVITEIAGALGAAQKVGVLHRNLGAESILRDGRDLKLYNFAVGDPQGGVSFGAIDCIAPEQVEGKNIDERTLVYNLAALTFRLLKGEPVFQSEDTGTALLQHAASLPPDDSMPAQLFAALAKDPKARPALSKFLGDLGTITREFPGARTGHDAPAMNDSDSKTDDAAKSASPAAAPKPAAPVPSLVTKPLIAPPPAVGPKAAAPSIAPPPAVGPKPSASASTPSIVAPNLGPPSFAPPSLSPPAAAPVTAPPVAAPSAAAGAPAPKPRTRGWTMFMEATDGESNGAAAPGVPVAPAAPVGSFAPVATPGPVGSFAPVPTPAPVGSFAPVATPAPVGSFAPVPTPVPAPMPVAAPTPAPAATPGEVKPSTRGWTMIMDEPSEADAAALAVTTPAAAVATPPPASPTTRGWTMLEELNEPTPDAAAAPAPAPEKADQSVAGNTPSSRGWTMFMEAELQGKEEGQPEAEPEQEPEFFDGPVTTESGTVVAFAPTSDAPNARAKEPDLSDGGEPMTSFGARLGRDAEAPLTPASPEPSTPAPGPDVPSFSGNTSFDFGGLTPPQPQSTPETKPAATPTPAPIKSHEPTHDAGDEVEGGGGGGGKAVIIGVVVIAIVVVVVVMMMGK